MNLQELKKELNDYIIKIEFDDYLQIIVAFPISWDIYQLMEDNSLYAIQKLNKTYEDNNITYSLYTLSIVDDNNINKVCEIILNIKNVFIAKELRLLELEQKLLEEKNKISLDFDEKIKELIPVTTNNVSIQTYDNILIQPDEFDDDEYPLEMEQKVKPNRKK
jgi:hypothetical protein